MKRVLQWLLSHKRPIILAALGVALFIAATKLLGFRVVGLFSFVIIWFINFALGAGAGWAAVRLWYFRHQPLIKWMGVYITAFIVDVIGAVVLLFVAKGVVLTWKFSTVMFTSTLLSNVLRAPLIIYLIRGPSTLTLPDAKKSGEMEPEFWLKAFRKIVREEMRRAGKVGVSNRRRQPPTK